MIIMKKSEVKSVLKELVAIWYAETDLALKLQIANEYLAIQKPNEDLFEDDISNGVPNHEVWRNCAGWEDLYQVSNYGRIKSVETFFIKTVRGRMMSVYKPELIRKTRKARFGYLRTSFWRDEIATHLSCHRLVALHFIPNPKNYSQVLHKDDDPGNPRWDNLFWGTQKHNIQDCVNKGRWHIGSKNNKAKLTESIIPTIREMINHGFSSRAIGGLFGVAKGQILFIKNRRTWKHVK